MVRSFHRSCALSLCLALQAVPATGQELTKTYVRITETASGVVVSWPAVPTATGYRIDRVKENDTCCNRSWSVGGTTTSATDAVSLPGVYQYVVTATIPRYPQVSAQGTFHYQVYTLDATPIDLGKITVVNYCEPAQVTAGVPPAGVRGEQGGFMRLSVSWDPVPGAAGYLVERQSWTGTWYKLGCLSGTATRVNDFTRTDVPQDQTVWSEYGRRYTYKVTAFTASGAAGWNSARVDMGATPAVLSNLSATRTGNSVNLCWNVSGNSMNRPSRFRITSSYGTDLTIAGSSVCTTVLGVPMGTQTFKVTGLYQGVPGFRETGGVTVAVTVAP